MGQGNVKSRRSKTPLTPHKEGAQQKSPHSEEDIFCVGQKDSLFPDVSEHNGNEEIFLTNSQAVKKTTSQYFNKSIHELYMRKGTSFNKLEAGESMNTNVFKLASNESEKYTE